MEIKELNIDKIPESGIIKILNGKALSEKEPKKLNDISGSIDAPFEFLTKRKGLESLNIFKSHIEFDLEKYQIVLITNEDCHYSNKITGKMIETGILNNLSINTGKRWECFELADFFRLNRSIFKSTAEAAKLVTTLNNFKAKVDKQMEQTKDSRANYNLQKRQVVESNLPESFIVDLPIFKGRPKVELSIEIDIDPSSLECVLISPQLAEIIQSNIEAIVQKQLDAIKELCPELVVIEV